MGESGPQLPSCCQLKPQTVSLIRRAKYAPVLWEHLAARGTWPDPQPREKMSFRITKLPAGRYLCPECFLGLLFSRSPSVLTTVTESFRISLSQWWNLPEKTELPQPRAVRAGMVTPGDSVSEVVDLELLGSGGFPHQKTGRFSR